MSILFLLIPLAMLLAGLGLAGFLWSVADGQCDDLETPAYRAYKEEP